jgi:hypothetical protein
MDIVDLQPADLALSIVGFVEDYQPGIVACEFVDAEGLGHTFIGKCPTSSPMNEEFYQPVDRLHNTTRCVVRADRAV